MRAEGFFCGLCEGGMIFSPYYRVFECPDCGERYRLDAILKQRSDLSLTPPSPVGEGGGISAFLKLWGRARSSRETS